MEINNEIRDEAIEFAKKQYEEIKTNPNSPDVSNIPLYSKLKSWNFFDKVTIGTEECENIMITLLSIEKYDKLVEERKPKPSKWEIVMGRTGGFGGRGGRKPR